MPWNQLILDVPDDLTDALVGELSDDGVAGVWESDGEATGLTHVVLYFGPRADLKNIEGHIHAIFARARHRIPAISKSVVEERDWTQEWKKSYSSFPVGDDFYIIPSWENCACPPDRLPIRIDPGQAFGTGTHETTQLTIDALERWIEPEHVVLDVGTGSGILAIVSRLLGAKEVLACDIDPVAAQVARANIDRNAEDNVSTFCGSVDAVRDEAISLTVCNLTADLIFELFDQIDRVLQPHGIAIFSGILCEQSEEVSEVISRYQFTIHEELIRGQWMALVTEKHEPRERSARP